MTLAFVLPPDAVSGSGPHVFPGFPGVWTPGEPVDAQVFVERGSFESGDEMRAAVAESGVPLEAVEPKQEKPKAAGKADKVEGEG